MTECRIRCIRKVKRPDCADLVLNTHYAGRWPSITYAFGLFVNDEIEGVATFGTPSSHPLRIGVAGDAYAKNVIELNRLVLRNNHRNDASWLVSRSVNLLKQTGNFIIVSFADISQGHVGTVYQASGFTYHGLSAKRTDWKVRGLEHLHGQTIADEFRGCESRAAMMREKYGSDFYLLPRPQKHRYLRIVGTRGFVAQASRSVKYSQEPFP